MKTTQNLKDLKQKNQELEKEMFSFFTHTMQNMLCMLPESLRQVIELLSVNCLENTNNIYKATTKIAAIYSNIELIGNLNDVFKQIIRDPEEFKQSWKYDNTGDATPKQLINKVLLQAIHGVVFCSDTTNLRKLFNIQETHLVRIVRKTFIDEVLLVNQTDDEIGTFLRWVEQHIPAIEINITNGDDLYFGTNNVRFLILFSIISELITNTLKYWDGEDRIKISWQKDEKGDYVFSTINHCSSNTTNPTLGSRLGIVFITSLLELLGEDNYLNFEIEDSYFKTKLTLNKNLF